MSTSLSTAPQRVPGAHLWRQSWRPLSVGRCFLLVLLWGPPISAQQRPAGAVQFPTAPSVQTRFAVQTIPTQEGTWGFVIERDGKPFIRQLSIPAIPGNRGFASPDKARKAAQLMVDKIRKGQMPPSLSREELQKANLF